jgi:hypothetical protein
MRGVKNRVALLVLTMSLAACASETTAPTQTSSAASSTPASAKAPDENAAMDALRKTAEAQTTHFKMNRRYALTYEELVTARLMPSEPTATQTGYEFRLRPAADAQTYRLSVVPSDAAATSARSFFLDQSGIIRAEAGKEATASSPEAK